jgi:uncharacterized membrane protein
VKNVKSDETRLDRWVSIGFRVGVAGSLACFVAGLILIMITGGPNIKPQIPLNQIPAAIVSTIGFLILLLTPIAQIIVAVVFFSMRRNKLFVGISLALLCFAAISLGIALT